MSTKLLFEKAKTEILQAYFANKHTWIVGYSGGKDSSATLQLIWEAISQLPPEKRTKHIHVISSDTLVETPLIKQYLLDSVSKINKAAQEQQIPISAEILKPIINDTFWVNLIGRGYPVPQQKFRWCTNRLKILTSSRFIQSRISQFGTVVVVLGTRKKESQARGLSMEKREIEDSLFSRNSQFESAFTYSPIRNWETWDVWRYLMQVNSPWGGDNQRLAQMYRDAEGECPFVVDEKTPPCGGSRFGCWVCTLVEKDKTITSLVASGETWLQPLLDYRNSLAELNTLENKDKYREYKLRRGAVVFKKGNTTAEVIRGPYTITYRKELLEKLLQTQIKVQKEGPDPSIKLINTEELHKIRNLWRTEESDWADSVPAIYNKYYSDIDWNIDDANRFNSYDKTELAKLSQKYGVPERLAEKLIDVEIQTRGMSYRASIFKKMDKIFNEEWRAKEDLIKEQEVKLRKINADN